MGRVNALAAAAGKIYVAGEFTRVGSARREHLAAFDAATGALAAWNPGVSGRDLPGDDVTVGRTWWSIAERCTSAASSMRSPAAPVPGSPRSTSRQER